VPRIKLILASTTVVLTLAAGLAFGQGVVGRADPELRAAQQSLEDALEHLQKARNSESAANVRARAFIALAETELDPAFDSLRRPGPQPR
jgi:hypothetical protein